MDKTAPVKKLSAQKSGLFARGAHLGKKAPSPKALLNLGAGSRGVEQFRANQIA